MPDPAAQGHRARDLSAAGAVEPTLPELLRAGWRRFGRPGRVAAAGGVALLAAGVTALAISARGESFAYDGPEAPPFSISWSELEREPAAAGSGALLALADRRGDELVQGLTVRPLEFGPLPSGEEPLPALGLMADRSAGELAERYPGARVVLEGRTLLAVDRGPETYQLAFTAPAGHGSILIGKRLLVPDPERPGRGVEIDLVERTGKPGVIEKVGNAPAGFFLNWPIQLLLEDAASVRTEEALEEPLRSFELG